MSNAEIDKFLGLIIVHVTRVSQQDLQFSLMMLLLFLEQKQIF